MLRFDVETIYKATKAIKKWGNIELRFDVETIYKATVLAKRSPSGRLRFDVETIYKATWHDKSVSRALVAV